MTVKKQRPKHSQPKWERVNYNLHWFTFNNQDKNNSLISTIRVCVDLHYQLGIEITLFCNQNHSKYKSLCTTFENSGFIEGKKNWKIYTNDLEACEKFLKIVDKFEPLENMHEQLVDIFKHYQDHLEKIPKWDNNVECDWTGVSNKLGSGILKEQEKILIFELRYKLFKIETSFGYEGRAVFWIESNPDHLQNQNFINAFKKFGKKDKEQPAARIMFLEEAKDLLNMIDDFEPLRNAKQKIFSDIYKLELTLPKPTRWSRFKHAFHLRPKQKKEDDSNVIKVDIKVGKASIR